MGKWLEILGERPPDSLDHSDRMPLMLAEIAPYPLLEVACYLGSHRMRFPMLDPVRRDSPAYVDEWLWLDCEQMGDLLAELRGIGRREEFLTGLNGQHYWPLAR